VNEYNGLQVRGSGAVRCGEGEMQAILEMPRVDRPAVSQVEAQRAANAYVTAQIDPAFEAVSGAYYDSQRMGKGVWRFIIRCEQGPLSPICVDAQTGNVIALASNEIRVIGEKAAILAARKQGALPVDEQGYVLGEYARRQASGYLDDQISMFYSGADPIFVSTDPPIWQVTIVFKMYDQGPFTLGMMDVDAKTGEPIPLAAEQIEQIRERTCAIIGRQTAATTAS
jgi:hypothetical protein